MRTFARFAQLALPLLVTTLLLDGCTTVPPAEPGEWRARDGVERPFSANGRMSIKRGRSGYFANFDWRDLGHSQTFDVNTPLGNTIASVCLDEKGIVARNNKRQLFSAPTGESMIRAMTGLDLPLDNLNLWALGFYNREIPHRVLGDGRLLQGGWTIERDLAADGDGVPRRLNIGKRDVRLKILFDEFLPYDAGSPGSAKTEGGAELCQKRSEAVEVGFDVVAPFEGKPGEVPPKADPESGDAPLVPGDKGADSASRPSVPNAVIRFAPRDGSGTSRSFGGNIQVRDGGKLRRHSKRGVLPDRESRHPGVAISNRKKRDRFFSEDLRVDDSVGLSRGSAEGEAVDPALKPPRIITVPSREAPRRRHMYNPEVPAYEV